MTDNNITEHVYLYMSIIRKHVKSGMFIDSDLTIEQEYKSQSGNIRTLFLLISPLGYCIWAVVPFMFPLSKRACKLDFWRMQWKMITTGDIWGFFVTRLYQS